MVSLLLARMLAPEYFGLLAIAMLAINSLIFLQELGFSSALIYRQSDVEEAAHTAHWAIIATSVMLYGAAFLLAPLIAAFFRSPEVTPVLRVLSTTIVISSFSRVPYALLFKGMDFRRKVIPEFVAGLVGNGFALVLAFAGWNVWALVAGEVINAILTTALVFVVYPWRAKWRFDKQLFREMLGYGKHVTASQVLIFGVTNIDDLFVGRMLGEASLGVYNMAYRVSNLPATNITRLVSRVTFPAFTQMQSDVARMRKAFFEVVHRVGLLAIPLAVATIVFAPEFVHIVLTDKWAAAIVPMQILAVYGLIRSVAANMGTIFQAGGKPQWLSAIAFWRLMVMAVLLYPAIRWGGLVGVCLLSVAVAVVDFAASAFLVDKIIDGRIATYFRLLGPMFLYAAVGSGLGYLAMQGLLNAGIWAFAALAVGGAITVLVYGALSWWRDQQVRQESDRLLSWWRGRRLPEGGVRMKEQETMEQENMDLQDNNIPEPALPEPERSFMSIVRRRWWIVALFVFGAVVVTAAVALAAPPVYRSTLRLQALALDEQEVTLYTRLSVGGANDQIAVTQANFNDVLQSPLIAWQTINDLKLNLSADEVLAGLKTTQAGDFVSISYEGASAKAAMDVLNTQVDNALRYYNELAGRPAIAAGQFITAEAAKQIKVLTAAQDALLQFQLEHNVGDLLREINAVQDVLRRQEEGRDAAVVDAERAEALAAEYSQFADAASKKRKRQRRS